MICSRCHCPITRQIEYTWKRGLIVCRTCWEIEGYDQQLMIQQKLCLEGEE